MTPQAENALKSLLTGTAGIDEQVLGLVPEEQLMRASVATMLSGGRMVDEVIGGGELWGALDPAFIALRRGWDAYKALAGAIGKPVVGPSVTAGLTGTRNDLEEAVAALEGKSLRAYRSVVLPTIQVEATPTRQITVMSRVTGAAAVAMGYDDGPLTHAFHTFAQLCGADWPKALDHVRDLETRPA